MWLEAKEMWEKNRSQAGDGWGHLTTPHIEAHTRHLSDNVQQGKRYDFSRKSRMTSCADVSISREGFKWLTTSSPNLTHAVQQLGTKGGCRNKRRALTIMLALSWFEPKTEWQAAPYLCPCTAAHDSDNLAIWSQGVLSFYPRVSE